MPELRCAHLRRPNFDSATWSSIHGLLTHAFETIRCTLTSLNTQRAALQKVKHEKESYEHDHHENNEDERQ